MCVCVSTLTLSHKIIDLSSSNVIITTSHLKSSPFNRRSEIKNWIPTLFYELTNSVPPLVHLREPGHPCWDFHAMYPRTADCAHFKPFRGDCAGSTRKSNMFWSFSEVRRSILNGAQHRPCRCSLQTASPALVSSSAWARRARHMTAQEVEVCRCDGWESEAAEFLNDTRDQRVVRAVSYPYNTFCCESPQPFFDLGEHGDFICRKTSSGYRGRER